MTSYKIYSVIILMVFASLNALSQNLGIEVERNGIQFSDGSIQTAAAQNPISGSTLDVVAVVAEFSNSIEGDFNNHGFSNDVEILRLDNDIFRDINASGAPGDSLHHRPIVITTNVGKASPDILGFFKNNSKIDNITISFLKSISGSATTFYRITLTNVKILEHRQCMSYENSDNTFRALEKFYLVYQTIEFEDALNANSTLMDWSY